MNLHSIVAPYIAAVNPMSIVGIQISDGSVTGPNGVRVPKYETPGALMASIAANVLNVTAQTAGKLQPGQTLSGVGLAAGTMITRQITGVRGGIGTYALSNEQPDLASVAMTTAVSLLAQIQPLTKSDLMQLEGLNLNGDKKKIYMNGSIDGVVRIELKGGDLVVTPNGQTWLVVQNLEGFTDTAGWVCAAMVLQNGS